MSQIMLDDKKAMDDINPFVNFMPGTSRQPHEFGKYTTPEDEPEEEIYKSPACDVISKNVGRPGYRENECNLSRDLLPGRNIDKGFTVISKDEETCQKTEKEILAASRKNTLILNLISLLCLILLIVMF